MNEWQMNILYNMDPRNHLVRKKYKPKMSMKPLAMFQDKAKEQTWLQRRWFGGMI